MGLSQNKALGYKFKRQHPYLNYILDFYCHQLKFAIEADGSIHDKDEVKENDAIRQGHPEKHGLSVLRFTNAEIKTKLENVIATIEHHLRTSSTQQQEQPLRPKSPL